MFMSEVLPKSVQTVALTELTEKGKIKTHKLALLLEITEIEEMLSSFEAQFVILSGSKKTVLYTFSVENLIMRIKANIGDIPTNQEKIVYANEAWERYQKAVLGSLNANVSEFTVLFLNLLSDFDSGTFDSSLSIEIGEKVFIKKATETLKAYQDKNIKLSHPFRVLNNWIKNQFPDIYKSVMSPTAKKTATKTAE